MNQASINGFINRQLSRQKMTTIRKTSLDDDGLIREIANHDENVVLDDDTDENDDDYYDQISLLKKKEYCPISSNTLQKQNSILKTNSLEDTIRNSKLDGFSCDKYEKDEIAKTKYKSDNHNEKTILESNSIVNLHVDDISEKWNKLPVDEELKELFPYILKYTPQHIETKYYLQSFIPDYIPAVGDVDAFLKVNIPMSLPNNGNFLPIEEHLLQLGLNVLDEPSSEQSEPSLINIKLRSTLYGSLPTTTKSTTIVPIAKTDRDIDKWIQDVENIHTSQLLYDVRFRKDIDHFVLNLPSMGLLKSKEALYNAYQQILSNQIDLLSYIKLICIHLDIKGPFDTQTDFLQCLHTLFIMYISIINQN